MSAREELFERLRRLRREGPSRPAADPAAGPAEAGARGLPDWLGRHLERRRGSAPPALPGPSALVPGPPQALEAAANARGAFAVRRARLPRGPVHGAWGLGEVSGACPRGIATLARDPALAGVDLARAVYLDIETTGLTGGAGTIPFLVALGTFTSEGEFELWQGFLRGPEEEPALLEEVSKRIAAAGSVVSFFGKSFDRHRLEDKMRLHGVQPPFHGRPHLDLYHPLQRLYRAAFADARLSTLEAKLCGVQREGDLSGRYAPEAWFDYLAGRAHRLEGVFRHNADDVLSLVVLAAHLGRALVEARESGAPLAGPGAARALGVARALAAERRVRDALGWVERALERGAARGATRLLRADLLRRAGETEACLVAYRELALEGAEAVALRASVELAKLEEHRRRDLGAALVATARARELAQRMPPGAGGARLLAELERRARRLHRRLAAAADAS